MQIVPFNELSLENICGYAGSDPVLFWAPRREEIQRFVEIAKLVSNNPQNKPIILDIGCGTGLLGYLLAMTNEAEIIGIDPNAKLVNESTYKHPNLRLTVGDSEDAVNLYANNGIDVVVNSWMPKGRNLTPDIRRIGAKAIIYIKEKKGSTGVDYCYTPEQVREMDKVDPLTQDELDNILSYSPGANYRTVFIWDGPTGKEIRHHVRQSRIDKYMIGLMARRRYEYDTPDMNQVEVQLRNDINIKEFPDITIPQSEKYPWEAKLEQIKGPLDKIRRVD